MQNTKFPWLSAFIILFIIGYAFFWAIKPANVPATTKKQVELIQAKKDSIITIAKIKSKNQVARAAAITKSLPREKPIIRDTTYAAMCEYITSYRAANTATIPSP